MAEKTDELTAKTRVPSSGPAADLLGRVIDHLLRTRDVNISLRQLAADIGTSHRMLLYHFGSRVELMVTVLLALNERDSLQVSGARTCAEFLRKWWRMYRTSAGQFNFSLYFAASDAASNATKEESAMLRDIGSLWREPYAELAMQEGLTKTQARSEARTVAATLRGIHNDVMLGGDDATTDATFEALVSMVTRRADIQ